MLPLRKRAARHDFGTCDVACILPIIDHVA